MRPSGFLLLLASCSGDGGGGGAGGDPCSGVDCSGHGDCVSDGAAAICACDADYVAEGLSCVPEGGDADTDTDTDTDADTDTDTGASPDIDDDGVLNEDDNCPAYPNADQDPAACTSREVVGGPGGSFATAVLRDGRVLLVGAFDPDLGDWVSQGWLYDPDDDGYLATAGVPEFDHHLGSGVTMRDGRVLVVGGEGFDNATSIEIFDPASGLFESTPPVPGAAYLGFAILLPDGDVLIGGGTSDAGPDRRTSTFDGETFRIGAPLPDGGIEPIAPSAVLLTDGRVLLTGGVSACGSFETGIPTDRAVFYDPDTRELDVAPGGLTAPRWGHGTSQLPDGRVLVFGGAHGECGDDPALFEPATDVEVYDPETGGSETLDGVTQMHLGGANVALADGTGLVAAGIDTGGTAPTEVVRVLSGGVASGAPFEPGPLTRGRGLVLHSGVLLQDGSVLVPGGNLEEFDRLDGADRIFPYYDVVIDSDHDGVVDALEIE